MQTSIFTQQDSLLNNNQACFESAFDFEGVEELFLKRQFIEVLESCHQFMTNHSGEQKCISVNDPQQHRKEPCICTAVIVLMIQSLFRVSSVNYQQILPVLTTFYGTWQAIPDEGLFLFCNGMVEIDQKEPLNTSREMITKILLEKEKNEHTPNFLRLYFFHVLPKLEAWTSVPSDLKLFSEKKLIETDLRKEIEEQTNVLYREYQKRRTSESERRSKSENESEDFESDEKRSNSKKDARNRLSSVSKKRLQSGQNSSTSSKMPFWKQIFFFFWKLFRHTKQLVTNPDLQKKMAGVFVLLMMGGSSWVLWRYVSWLISRGSSLLLLKTK